MELAEPGSGLLARQLVAGDLDRAVGDTAGFEQRDHRHRGDIDDGDHLQRDVCSTSGLLSTRPASDSARPSPATPSVDLTTHDAYATNIEDTSITTIDGDRCRGTQTSGCAQTVTRPIVGDYPHAITVDPAVRTAYVADQHGVCVIGLTR